MLRHRRRVQSFLALGKRPELLFQGQVLFAGFGRAAHAGEAMVFGGHRPIFGGIDHGVLPRSWCPPTRPRSAGGAGGNGVGRGSHWNKFLNGKSRTLCSGVSSWVSVRLYAAKVERQPRL